MGRTKGSGQGSIYKRGDKWRGQITIDGRRYSYTADKKKDVLDYFASIRNDAPAEESYTLEEWMEYYFRNWYVHKVSANTYDNSYSLIKNHLYPVLGNINLENLTTQMIQDAYPKMWAEKSGKKYRSCKYSDGTIKIFSSVLNQALTCAQNEGLIRKNPFYGVIVPKAGTPYKVEAFTADEQRLIVEYTKNSSGIDFVFYMLIATGMRVGECIALTWGDVDLKEGSINITKTAINRRGHMIIQDHPKTEQSVRKIYLSENTRQLLKDRLDIHERRADELVLPNAHGKIYHTSALRSRWIKVCAELGIPYRNLHALRHSWATRALEGHVEVQTVSKMLGHTSVATTMDIYQSVFTEQKKKAAQIMNKFV